jgi:hypothetical protein
MFHFTKSSLVLYLSIILVTGSLLQISSTPDFFENNKHIKIPLIYAQDGIGGEGNGGEGNGGDLSDDNRDNENIDEGLTLREEDDASKVIKEENIGEILTLENGEEKTEQPPTEPSKVENATSLQETEQKVLQVLSRGTDKELEEYLDKTRDERVDRRICGHSPYYGEWNYDTKQCEIDNPDLKQEYEKERKEFSRFDQALCPGYGGEWNNKEKECEIEDLEERTAYEDTLCDDPADSILYDICNFERYKGKTGEQIKEYDKNQCIYVFDGKWNEDTSSCETENEEYQKYLNERHDIYSCIFADDTMFESSILGTQEVFSSQQTKECLLVLNERIQQLEIKFYL